MCHEILTVSITRAVALLTAQPFPGGEVYLSVSHNIRLQDAIFPLYISLSSSHLMTLI
jgi:hypothetical protein